MPNNIYEIRRCDSCGLRYPIMQGHPHGTRCPACMGSTRVILTRELVFEPEPDRPESFHRKIMTPAKKSKEESGKNLVVLLDNVRSAWNVGSIFRSADGFGFDHAYLCGISPTPENEAVQKTSLGAEDTVTWSHHMDAVKLVKGLKKEGWKVYALEDDKKALPIDSASTSIFNQRGVLIVGNEVTGVDPELLELCDAIYFIPMRGDKKSFNVAIAFSIAAYALK